MADSSLIFSDGELQSQFHAFNKTLRVNSAFIYIRAIPLSTNGHLVRVCSFFAAICSQMQILYQKCNAQEKNLVNVRIFACLVVIG